LTTVFSVSLYAAFVCRNNSSDCQIRFGNGESTGIVLLLQLDFYFAANNCAFDNGRGETSGGDERMGAQEYEMDETDIRNSADRGGNLDRIELMDYHRLWQ